MASFVADCVEQLFDADVMPGDVEFRFSSAGEIDQVVMTSSDTCSFTGKPGKTYTVVARRLDTAGAQLGAASEPYTFSVAAKSVLIPVTVRMMVK